MRGLLQARAVCGRAAIVVVACFIWPAALGAQTLLDDYARAVALVNYMTAYVAESLLGCAARSVLTQEQAEARFKAYEVRNAALLDRAEAWTRQAERRLQAQGEESAARLLSQNAGLAAVGEALRRVEREIGAAGDARALCAAKIAAIEAGRYDASGNAELIGLLEK